MKKNPTTFNPENLLNSIFIQETEDKTRDFQKEDVTIDPETAISTLQQRVAELEQENATLRSSDNRGWKILSANPNWERCGLTQDQYAELEQVARHFNYTTGSSMWLMMRKCLNSPIPQREKLVLFFLCLVHSKQESQ